MKLLDYINSKQMAQADFARLINALPQTVERYVNNKRIPRPEIIQKITAVTNGAVTANDFYNLPKKPPTAKKQ